MDEVLIRSGIEDACIAHHVGAARRAGGAAAKPLSDRRRATIQRQARQGLGCTVARILSNESHRSFSCHLAESALPQWFCEIRCDGIVRVRSGWR